MVIPEAPSGSSSKRQDRLLALAQQQKVEVDRLIRHQRIAVQLTADPEDARRLINAAIERVNQWEKESLCSDHYISRWRKVLSLPVRDLAIEITGEMDGWGPALRQNSPWPAAL